MDSFHIARHGRPTARPRAAVRTHVVCALMVVCAVLPGCVAGSLEIRTKPGVSTGFGSLIVIMDWPTNLATARALPSYTEKVDVSLRGTSDAGPFEITRQIRRYEVVGTQAATQMRVPAGTGYQLTVVGRDIEGNPVAFGQQLVSVNADSTTTVIVTLVPLGAGDNASSLPLIVSYIGTVTSWTGNFLTGETPPAEVLVDLYGLDSTPSVGRVTYIIHDEGELWLVHVSGSIDGNSVSANSDNTDFLQSFPLKNGGVTPFGGYTTDFTGSLRNDDLSVASIEDSANEDDATIVVSFARGFTEGSEISGTVTATTFSGRRLVGSFVCAGAVRGDGGGLPGVPNLTKQIGIHITDFSGNFAPSSFRDVNTASMTRQLTFTGLDALIFIDVFGQWTADPITPPSAAVTMVLHNDKELWQIRSAVPVYVPYIEGAWHAPEHVVDYFPGFTSGVGGYTTDFTGHALDFSLISNGIEDPLIEWQGMFVIDLRHGESVGSEVTGEINAVTSGGRTLVGSFRGTVRF